MQTSTDEILTHRAHQASLKLPMGDGRRPVHEEHAHSDLNTNAQALIHPTETRVDACPSELS